MHRIRRLIQWFLSLPTEATVHHTDGEPLTRGLVLLLCIGFLGLLLLPLAHWAGLLGL